MKPRTQGIRGGNGRLVGYARVSTGEQDTEAQVIALKAAGCAIIFQDTGSGSNRDRPQLARALDYVGAGDTLIVARLDRLARSLSHLLELTEGLRAKGAHFRSLADPFDTSSPQGMLMMQMLGAFAEFERTLIRERTKAGIAAAVARGARPGNPRLRDHDPIAIRMMKAALADTTLERTRIEARSWVHVVEKYRPHLSWVNVTRLINRERARSERIHVTTLKAQVRRLVRAGDLSERVLDRARPPTRDVAALLVQRIRAEQPKTSLRALAAELDRRGFHPPRGHRWSPETVRRLLNVSPDFKAD